MGQVSGNRATILADDVGHTMCRMYLRHSSKRDIQYFIHCNSSYTVKYPSADIMETVNYTKIHNFVDPVIKFFDLSITLLSVTYCKILKLCCSRTS